VADAPEGALTAEAIDVVYSSAVKALDRVSLTVAPGEIVALLGANGAGKTTTLRALGGFAAHEHARITGGSVWFNGRDITRLRPEGRARLGLGIVPESGKIFERLTVAEHLRAAFTRSQNAEVERVLEMFPRLRERAKKLAGLLSGGERQMLAIAITLANNPKVLMIDELSLGLAPQIIDDLLATLVDIRDRQGTAILLVEQNVDKAFEVADRCYLMATGRIIREEAAAALRGRPDVWELILGRDIVPGAA
jgi:branched-chain amino acid transport system ATP-binding protein